MGTVYTSLTLSNARDAELKPVQVRALVDTGTMYLSIPEHVAIQLRLEPLHQREVTLANGNRHLCPYVGPIRVQFEDRACFTGALILGDEVLMGAIPMEDIDLVVTPLTRSVTVNPQSPNIPSSLAKSGSV